MSILVTEFTAHNAFVLDEAYGRACRYVESLRSVSVVDLRDTNRPAIEDVEISIYAAKHTDLGRPTCVAALKSITARQESDFTLTIAIASLGRATESDIEAYLSALGTAPVGSSRWMEVIADAVQLYELIVRWLLLVLDRKSGSGTSVTSIASEAALSIDSVASSASDPDEPWSPLSLRVP